MSLIDKIRKARETTIPLNGKTWTIRRPTDEEMNALIEAGYGNREMMMHLVKTFTIGWELQEIDLIPGGNPEKVPFDSAVFAEYVADKPELWAPLGSAVVEAFNAYTDKRDAALKNS